MKPWRLFIEWRERRSALSDMEKRRIEEQALYVRNLNNSFNLALSALERGDLGVVAEQWDLAQATMPEYVASSRHTLRVLMSLERYDEAEAHCQAGLRGKPRDFHFRRGLALIAEARGEYESALARWRALPAEGEDYAEARLHEARNLLFLKRDEEADRVLTVLTRRRPEEVLAWTELARVAERRQDWARAETFWRHLTTFEPGDVGSYHAGLARAQSQQGRDDAAEATLRRARVIHPGDLEVVVTSCHVAMHRGDVAVAAERWALVRLMARGFQEGYREGARCSWDAGRPDEAEDIIREAIERFPDEVWPLFEYAVMAHQRRDWREAVIRWSAVLTRFPGHEEALGLLHTASDEAAMSQLGNGGNAPGAASGARQDDGGGMR